MLYNGSIIELTHFNITLFPIYSAQTLQKHWRVWNFGIKVLFFSSLCASRVLFYIEILTIESANGSGVPVDVSLKENRERNSQFVA